MKKAKRKEGIVIYCGTCNKIRHFGNWVIPDTEVKKQIQEKRANGCLRWKQETCDECEAVKV